MGIIYLLIGVLIGTHTSRLLKTQRNKTEEESTDIHKDEKRSHKSIRIRKKMKKYFALNSDSPEGIDPEKIKVSISKGPERNRSSPEPNFMVLVILWAHFVAKQFGLLAKDQPAPWQLSDYSDRDIGKTNDIDLSSNSWKNFLANVVKDKSWPSWIRDPNEIKQRTILAFES